MTRLPAGRRPRLAALAGAALAGALLLAPAALRAQGTGSGTRPRPGGDAAQQAILKNVGLDQKLNAQVPLDATFRDETGRTVRLGEYFGKKPVALILIQLRCTMLCSEEMKLVAESLRELKFTVGKEFDLVVVSIDHREQPELAADYKKHYVEEYGRPGSEQGWHFLTGDKEQIGRVADSIGFRFSYDPKTDQFAHPDGLMILTPKGRVARYYFHLNYPPRDLRFGLIEAAADRIGTPIDAIALLCYHYDPVTGTYGVAVIKIVRLAGIATVLCLAAGILLLRGRDRLARRRGGEVALQGDGWVGGAR